MDKCIAAKLGVLPKNFLTKANGKTAYGVSNGYVTDDVTVVTCPCKVKIMAPIGRFEPNISKTAVNAI